jgi:hypothetical protein
VIRIITSNGPVSVEVRADRLTFYSIEVYDPAGDLLARVPKWISGQHSEQMDAASELTLRVVVGAEGEAELVRPNSVWLRDRWGFVIGTFQIQKRSVVGSKSASYVDLTMLSSIAQLGEEVITGYTGADLPVSEHIAALLALQEKSDPLTLGTIDETIAAVSLPHVVPDSNIHAALLALQAALPRAQRGHIYVDPQRRLQWRLAIGDSNEQVITRALNVSTVSAETDYSRTINKLWLYGEGQDPSTRLTLLDAGESEEFITDADSVTAYGLYKSIKTDKRITTPEVLQRVANRILEEFATPPVTVSIDLLDVAKADNAPTGVGDIYIGGSYRVVDADLGIDASVEIVGISTDLTRPVPIRVDLANQTRTLDEVIGAILDGLYQPLDVLGDRYPNMGRNFSDGALTDFRAGDTRWNDDDGVAEMFDGTDWSEMGGGDVIWYTATTKAGLPDATTVAITALGRVTGGADNGMICVVNEDGDGWDALNFCE